MKKRSMKEMQEEEGPNILGSHIINVEREGKIKKLETELEEMDASVI